MSIQTELTRIQGLRNAIRAVLITWGVLTNSAADLGDCSTAINGVTNNGAVAATIDGLTVTSYTVPAGYHSGAGTVSLTGDIETALATI